MNKLVMTYPTLSELELSSARPAHSDFRGNANLHKLARTRSGVTDYIQNRTLCLRDLARQLSVYLEGSDPHSAEVIKESMRALRVRFTPPPDQDHEKAWKEAPLSAAIADIEAYFHALLCLFENCCDGEMLRMVQQDRAVLVPVLQDLQNGARRISKNRS